MTSFILRSETINVLIKSVFLKGMLLHACAHVFIVLLRIVSFRKYVILSWRALRPQKKRFTQIIPPGVDKASEIL